LPSIVFLYDSICFFFLSTLWIYHPDSIYPARFLWGILWYTYSQCNQSHFSCLNVNVNLLPNMGGFFSLFFQISFPSLSLNVFLLEFPYVYNMQNKDVICINWYLYSNIIETSYLNNSPTIWTWDICSALLFFFLGRSQKLWASFLSDVTDLWRGALASKCKEFFF
jgi:hypothetical protein